LRLLQIKKILPSRRTAKDSVTTLTGDFVSKGFLLFVNLILMKVASPEDFGLFTIYVTFLGLGQQFSDLGINQGVIKYYSAYKEKDPNRANGFIELGFKLKFLSALTLSLIYLALAYPTAIYGYNQTTHALPLAIAALGTFGGSMLDYIQGVFQGKQDYKKLAIIKVSEGFMKLGGLLLLIFIKEFTVDKTFWIYSIVPFLIFIIGYNMNQRVKTEYDKKSVFSELLGFSKWIFYASLSTMIMVRIDILMLSFMNTNDLAGLGVYNAGIKLCVPLQVAAASMNTVFFPKAMEIKNRQEIKSFIFSTLKITLPLSICFVVFAVIVELFLPNIFPNYIGALPIFHILVIAFLFNLLGNPITVILFAIDKQKVALKINIIQLFVNILANMVLYHYFNGIGIAIGTLITYLTGGSLTFYYILRYLKK
jgi:O-antigen/teichoic acid export membrane protein